MAGRRFVGHEGLSAFNASVRDTLVGQTITAPDAGGFRATLTAAPVARARVVTAAVAPLAARRGPEQTRRAAGSVFLLACERGRGEIRHAGGVDTIAPGRLVIVPGTAPFEVGYPVPARVVFVVLPEAEVAERFPALDGPVRSHDLDPVGRRVSRRWGELAHLADGLEADAGTTDADRHDLGAVLDATLHLALRRTLGDLVGDPRVALRADVRALVDRHLTDPALSPVWIARRLAVSLRQLHRAFEGSGTTVAALIRQRRLEAIARALADPAQQARTVTELAARHGFASASHLGGWFREAYGTTPTQWRRRGGPGHGSGGDAARA